MKNNIIATEFSLIEKGNTFVGEKRNYQFSLIKYQIGNVTTPALQFVFNHTIEQNEIKQLVKAHKGGMHFLSFEFPKDTIVVLLPIKFGMKDEKYIQKCTDILNKALDSFDMLGLKQYQECFVCQENRELDPKEMRVLGDSYVPIHSSCMKNLVETAKAEIVAEEAQVGNLPLSIVLALIGAVIGTVPAIVVLLTTSTFYAILYALIPLASFFGYKLGKAPKKSYMTLIIVLASIALALGSTYFIWNLMALAEEVTMEFVYNTPELFASFMSDMVTSFIFVGIGIFISWKYISKTTTQTKKAIERFENK